MRTQVPFGAQSASVVQSKLVGQFVGGMGQAEAGQHAPPVQHLTGAPPQSDTSRQANVRALPLVSLHAGVPEV